MHSGIQESITRASVVSRSAPPVEARILAVMYHYVHDRPAGLEDGAESFDGVRGLTTGQFREQIGRLCATFEPIDWPRFYAWSRGQAALPRDGFLLTFDDGLADHAQHVAPILEAHGLRGTFFVSGEVLAVRRMLAAHMIHLLLSHLGDERMESESRQWLIVRKASPSWCAALDVLMENPTGDSAGVYHYESPRRGALKYWLTMVLPVGLRNELLRELFAGHVGMESEWSRRWYMDWDDLSALHWKGHTIGGHGFSHEPFERLSPQEQQRDLGCIAAILSDNLGEAVRPFSYPYGSGTAVSGEVFEDAGFVQAFSTVRDWVARDQDQHGLPRVDTIHVDAFLESSALCEAV